MKKCNICFDEIKTDEFTQFQEFDCVDSDDALCLRLKCGHAYHTNCIINLFRRNERCPICRQDLVKKENEIEWFENDSEPNEDDLAWITLDTLARQERCKNNDLKEKRKELNLTIKSFHSFHQDLKHIRRQQIKEVLKNFRDEHLKVFRAKVKTVQKVLNVVKKIEKDSISKTLLENVHGIHSNILQEYFRFNPNYDAASLLLKNDVNINGFTRKFWN